MKKIGLLLFLACGFALTSCEEDKTLDETRVTTVTEPSTTLEVEVNKYDATFSVALTDGNPKAIEYGVMLSKDSEMAMENVSSYAVDETGSLTLSLDPGTTYYVCSYALTSNSLVKSEVKEFATESHPLINFLGNKTLTGLNLFAGGEVPLSVKITPDANDESIAYFTGLVSEQVGIALGTIKLVFDVENGTCTIPAGQVIPESNYGDYQYVLLDDETNPLNGDIVGTINDDNSIDFSHMGAMIVKGGNAGLFHWAYMYMSIY